MTQARWTIAAAGVAIQVCLGTVYAWSYFQKPLMAAHGWSNSQVAWVFSLAICFLGLSAAGGGLLLPRWGPRRLAMLGGALFGAGHLLAAWALALGSLPLLWLGYGVVGGCGLGLGYVVPVATAARWFPDRKGLVTGLVVMGFGLGALVMSKLVAPWLLHLSATPTAPGGDLVRVFLWLGLGFAVAVPAAGACLRDPPSGWVTSGASGGGASSLLSRRFLAMWGIFCCNITAGIMFIGFQSPMLQDLLLRRDPAMTTAALAAAGATLIGLSSLCNGIGRILWGAVSDRLGRAVCFRLLLGIQALALGALACTGEPWLFGALVCLILLCYGGGFGAMPAFVLDVFGARRMPVLYGAILTAWSVGGILGPQTVALIKDRIADPVAQAQWTCGAGIAVLILGLGLSALVSDKPEPDGG